MKSALSPKQLKRLLSVINLNSPFGKRDYLLILFLYHTGLRVSELAGLNVEHVSHHGVPKTELYLAKGLTKNRQARVIPLNTTAQAVVSKLLAFNRSRGFRVAPGCPLLRNRRHKRLTVRCIQRVVKGYRDQAGLSIPATPHTLRHSFATQTLARTGNLRVVQSLLGHRQLNSTGAYTHPGLDEKSKVVATLG